MLTLKDHTLLRDQCFINGQWMDASSGDALTVTNPADGSTLGRVPALSRREIAEAIAAAQTAWPAPPPSAPNCYGAGSS